MPGESGVLGGVSANQIRMIYVGDEHVQRVGTFLRQQGYGSIPVNPLSVLEREPSLGLQRPPQPATTMQASAFDLTQGAATLSLPPETPLPLQAASGLNLLPPLPSGQASMLNLPHSPSGQLTPNPLQSPSVHPTSTPNLPHSSMDPSTPTLNPPWRL